MFSNKRYTIRYFNYFANSIFDIFFPKTCIICNNLLYQNEDYFCFSCKCKIPINNYNHYNFFIKNNIFWPWVELEFCNSFLLFTKEGICQKILFQIKYFKNIDLGYYIGNWYGQILKENHIFKKVDFIVPIPLHPKKIKKRGFNQSEIIAQNISKKLKCEINNNILLKTINNSSQTNKNKEQRFNNTIDIFSIDNNEKDKFENKHIMLFDDVITTGATAISAINELKKIKGIKLSFISLAYRPF